MTEEQLKENGYPMPHPEKPGRAVLFTAEEKKSTDCKLGCFILHSLLPVSQVQGGACPTCSTSLCVEMFCSQHGAAFARVATCCAAVQPGIFRIFHLDKLQPCYGGGEEKLLVSTW